MEAVQSIETARGMESSSTRVATDYVNPVISRLSDHEIVILYSAKYLEVDKNIPNVVSSY